MLIKDKNFSHLKGTIAGASSYRKMNDLCMHEIKFFIFPIINEEEYWAETFGRLCSG